jgi:predicted ATPase
MIKVDRTRVARPQYLDTAAIAEAFEVAAAYYRLPREDRTQRSFWFPKAYTAPELVEAVGKLFDRKCAFCESSLENATVPTVAHYRPAEGSVDNLGNLDPEYYWWLASTWENLYAVCFDCIRAKGLRFPVDGGRARLEAPHPEVLATEKAMLLDPCHDDPERHLLFSADGRVSSSTERGRATIDIVGLNRSTLVSRRATRAQEMRSGLQAVSREMENPQFTVEAYLTTLLDPNEPFVALRRSLAHAWLWAQPEDRRSVLELHLADLGGTIIPLQLHTFLVATPEDVATYEVYERGVDAYSAAAPDERYYAKSRMVERIELENFRAFSHLDLPFTSRSETAPWMMLLGENGLGKSSILQAIALTLIDDVYRRAVGVQPEEVLRNDTQAGRVKLWLTGRTDSIDLSFSAGDGEFHSSEPDPKMLILGYGATRLFPRSRLPTGATSFWARVHNLFDPFQPLVNPTAWFLSLPEERFHAAARVAKELLSLPEQALLVKDGDRMRIEDGDRSRLSFEQLSDGYQSMLSLAADIMSVMLERWPDMKAAEGLVLLDEIESHLHPSWKMRIVSSLRTSFPRLQFIATTHDPLCLRGLKSGEVVVLRRDLQGEVFAVTDLPDVEALRVDQLLTSEHFGLNSTIDPHVEVRFRRYYDLLAKVQLTPAEEAEKTALKQQIDQFTVLGVSARERVVLEAADQYVADSRRMADPEARMRLKEATRQRVTSIWSGVKERSGA